MSPFRLSCVFLVLAASLVGPPPAAAQDRPADWQAGVASAVITPRDKMWMAGYAARKKPAEGKAQDLYAKALAVQDEKGGRLVIVTLDLISVPRVLRDRLEQVVQEKYGLPREGLLLNCSHTHCGPELRFTAAALAGPDADRARQAKAYAERLEGQLVEIIGRALDGLAPARLSYLRARCGFAMNRRQPTPTGYTNSPYPDGPVDHEVPVLRVEGADGKLRAVLFGYACHNTTLGFYEYCGDYAGYAQEQLEKLHPGVTALFLMGCGGDQNPYPRGSLDLAQHHGQTLATAVQAALQTPPRPVRGPLRCAYDLATLEYSQPLPTLEQLEQRAATAKNEYEKKYAERLRKQLAEKGSLPASYACPIQVVHFGDDLTLAALPGETVVDYSLRLKRELGAKGPAVWVAGYSNDVFTYLPSLRVLKEGGYEAGGAMIYSSAHPAPFAENVEERIVGKVHDLDRCLRP